MDAKRKARNGRIRVVALLTTADHLTTWLGLRRPVDGFVVHEANPYAAWLFDFAGLVPGLVLDSVATFWELLLLVTPRRFSPEWNTAMLASVAVATGHAVTNNLFASAELGIAPFGVA